VPSEKLPYDFFAIGLAEVLIRSGQKDEGEKLIGSIINYSREYLEYAAGLGSDDRFGLDYPTGLSMQALLDIYKVAVALGDDNLINMTETLINNYYDKLYSRK
jgi:hypothetical protein